jgi:hypothetical protein
MVDHILKSINLTSEVLLNLSHTNATALQKLVEINQILDKIENQLNLLFFTKNNERQWHVFVYERVLIKQYNLTPSTNYTGTFDAYDGSIPVQIKFIKDNGEVCLGDYIRNMNKSQNFILHVAFYKNKYDTTNINQYTLYIDYTIYLALFKLRDNIKYIKSEFIKSEFMNISNDKKDDERFKVFKNTYKKDDGIISVRFKRDHKKQKRIQAAISYTNFEKFIKLFKPYEFKINNTNIMTLNNSTEPKIDRRKLEKFYTKSDVAKLCMKHVKQIFKKLAIVNPHVLEPAAGSGIFINEFDEYTYTAYDILPESDLIEKADFLEKPLDNIIKPEYKNKNLAVIGNPPYKLAIKFINKCADLKASVICFILPNVFKKPTIINKINRYYHLIKQIELPKNSFKLADVDYDVPSNFFIFVRKAQKRPLINLDEPCVGYKYVSFSSLKNVDGVITGADISVIRVGGRAGKSFLTTDTSDDASVSKQKYNYFIKLDNIYTIAGIIAEINQVEWSKNNTTGPRSIGKYELNPILNNIISKLHLV